MQILDDLKWQLLLRLKMMKLTVRTRAPTNATSSANSDNMIKGSSNVKTAITSSFTSCFRGKGGVLSPPHRFGGQIVEQPTIDMEDGVKNYRKLSQMEEGSSMECQTRAQQDTDKAKKQQRSHGNMMKQKEHKKESLCSTSKLSRMIWSPRKSGKVIQLTSPKTCAKSDEGEEGSWRRKSLGSKVKEAYEQVLEATKKGGPYVNEILLVGNHLFVPMSPACSPASSPRFIKSSPRYACPSPRLHGMASPSAPSPFHSRGRPEAAIASSPASSPFRSRGPPEAFMASSSPVSSPFRSRGLLAAVKEDAPMS